MFDRNFLPEFKRATEERWAERPIDPSVYGFQFQPGTRWNIGLSREEIVEYEAVLAVSFPHDFRDFLGAMNGTDLPTLNVYGSSGEPPRTSTGVYSYPRDVKLVKQRIEDVRDSRSAIAADLWEQGFDLPAEAQLVPIYFHRYVVCTPDLNRSPVLSIADHSTDAIVYASSLREYLEREFLND